MDALNAMQSGLGILTWPSVCSRACSVCVCVCGQCGLCGRHGNKSGVGAHMLSCISEILFLGF